ncbi:MAG: hypothetical protein GY904_33945 [Planctomycetaceae bacterium]|nr:hypothetical protein [Planctomycetaceae bacterium]
MPDLLLSQTRIPWWHANNTTIGDYVAKKPPKMMSETLMISKTEAAELLESRGRNRLARQNSVAERLRRLRPPLESL